MKLLWMAVTADEYELPLAVADTLSELTKTGYAWGMHPGSICTSIRLGRTGKISGRRFIRVEIDENEEE